MQGNKHWAHRKFASWGRHLAAAALLGVLFENFCCITPSVPAAELPPIVIGVSNVQSGPSSMLGQTLLLGSKAYFDLVNQHGGIRGRKIAIILKDDKYEPDPAVQNTNELIEQDKVFFLFDYVGTPTLTRVLPLLKYYEKEGIVNVAPFTGADPQRTPPYDRFVFNIRASYREETRALVRYLYHQGYRRIGFLGQADAYGKSGEIGVNAALLEYGLKIVSTVTYPRNQGLETPMTSQVKLTARSGCGSGHRGGSVWPLCRIRSRCAPERLEYPDRQCQLCRPHGYAAEAEPVVAATGRGLDGSPHQQRGGSFDRRSPSIPWWPIIALTMYWTATPEWL